ncbi:hypothetical protein ACB092_10G029800 [Castanea dentata]
MTQPTYTLGSIKFSDIYLDLPNDVDQLSFFLNIVKLCVILSFMPYIHVSLIIMIKFCVGLHYLFVYLRPGLCKLHLNCQYAIGNPYRNLYGLVTRVLTNCVALGQFSD